MDVNGVYKPTFTSLGGIILYHPGFIPFSASFWDPKAKPFPHLRCVAGLKAALWCNARDGVVPLVSPKKRCRK